MILVESSDVLRALQKARRNLGPQEILAEIGLDSKVDKNRKAVDRRLRELKNAGLVEHDHGND